jgi:hypothetical protein
MEMLRAYTALRCRWCDTVLNVYASTEDNGDDTKDSFYEELARVFYIFPKYNTKILLLTYICW